ncbi:AAA family ATPase [Lactiplantibacillus pingfangensis]|uniref:AAA family ATPase n=1 Tax=Lactiplantibacillus pingfangensis TaxID=2559915 RepID=UPI0010F721E4|nr:AAA family ATPase [Lactiplantibacillus pingfangensis]
MKFYEDGKIPVIPNMYFIYGDGGTGKTSLVRQFVGHKLLFSFDLSSNVLIGNKDVDVVIFEHQDAPNVQGLVEQMIMRAIANPKYQIIVLDNVTALQNLVLANINDSKDNRQNYQALQLWFRDLGTILKESGKTIYATAHQIDNGSDGMNNDGRFAADMNEKTFNAFTGLFDLVGRIYLKDGKRMIDMDPEKGNHAKNRIDERKLINADELIKPKGEK